MTSHIKLLSSQAFPEQLFDPGTGYLRFPDSLRNAYEHTIDHLGLRAMCLSPREGKGPIGGIDEAATHDHFARSYCGSVARVLLAILDPHDEVPQASNSFIRILSGNEICLVDAPIGTGAATLAFLSAVAELRRTNVLPRQRLFVRLIGAEISVSALDITRKMLEELKETFEEQAIFVSSTFVEWDILSDKSNVDLVKSIVRVTEHVPRVLFVVANFSGFLTADNNYDAVKMRIEELFKYSSGDTGSVGVWIEPSALAESNKKNSIARRIVALFNKGLASFTKLVSSNENGWLISKHHYHRPLSYQDTPQVRLAVMPIQLDGPR